MMKTLLFKAVLFFIIAITVQSTLSIYNAEALGSKDSELKNISYSIANYGFIP